MITVKKENNYAILEILDEDASDSVGGALICIDHFNLMAVRNAINAYWRDIVNKKYTKQYVDGLFAEYGVITVTFIKRNGDEREMTCTKDLAEVPEEKRPSGEGKERPANEDLCTVYEIDNDWRSFRYDSVIGIKYEDIEL